MSEREPGAAAAAAADPMPQGEPPRIRFIALRVQRSTSGRAQAEVELARIDGGRVTGSHAGQAIALGDLRIAAEATLAALHLATTTDHRFELTGVKSLRVFDQTVVLVQIAVVSGRGPARLVGAAFGEQDSAQAAVLAVLNATNRVL
jgi:hypothetical protein